jgi:hypothetical protein
LLLFDTDLAAYLVYQVTQRINTDQSPGSGGNSIGNPPFRNDHNFNSFDFDTDTDRLIQRRFQESTRAQDFRSITGIVLVVVMSLFFQTFSHVYRSTMSNTFANLVLDLIKVESVTDPNISAMFLLGGV